MLFLGGEFYSSEAENKPCVFTNKTQGPVCASSSSLARQLCLQATDLCQHTSGHEFELTPDLFSNVIISKEEHDHMVCSLLLRFLYSHP
jgi:hypothetical protein